MQGTDKTTEASAVELDETALEGVQGGAQLKLDILVALKTAAPKISGADQVAPPPEFKW